MVECDRSASKGRGRPLWVVADTTTSTPSQRMSSVTGTPRLGHGTKSSGRSWRILESVTDTARRRRGAHMRDIPISDDFPPDFYEEVGRLVIAFGRLEYLIKLCFKDLHGNGFTIGMAEAEYDAQSFADICGETGKLTKLAKSELSTTEADAFCELIKKASPLGTFRNDAVHAWWYADVKGLPSRIRPKRDSHELADWSRGRVVQVSEIRSAREEIERFYRDLDTQRGTWTVRNP